MSMAAYAIVYLVSIFTPTCVLGHDDYILVHIIVVLNKLKYYPAQYTLKTFYYTCYYLYFATDVFFFTIS